MDVGWIGTGRMGTAMAERLADAGATLTVWNRTIAKAEPLRDRGAALAGSPAELRGKRVVFTMLSDDAALEAVLTGDDGLLTGIGPVPDVVVDCSTVSPETSAAARRACANRGAAFLAAPVSGNPGAVRSGRLAIAVSGPRDAYDRVAPLLARIGGSVSYMGDGDSARLVKIAHNLLLGVLTQGLAEITVLAEKGGVPRRAVLEFLNNSVLGSVFTRYKTPAFVNLDFTPTFTPPLLNKDFDLGLSAARTLDVPMPVVELTARLVRSLVDAGHVDEDFAVLLIQQAAAAGVELTPENATVDDGLGR
ncbi:3-hydroxyisobutyrate dehydrogenase [Actinomadura sp. NBRC 104425]|uniref:NAD(P)-dependent oxidoreductase n=1 Tax=Actinomadura sp. NBRC 104425 TaxID=3032204 RepID=UPI0024A5B69C|nr:NAD(P)-dependent oxidoreductase [Actinomadura sp. NBRC 104425]GLZ14433.1 3-hydroxyisobutyrate dehydrogenase [Actinomadura sp. NBRC 104425]